MRKILLITAIAFLMFQIIILAYDIEIGMPAINRPSSFGQGHTVVNKGVTATGSGIITKVEIWGVGNLTNCQVATFFVVSGNNLSTRDTEYIGNVTGGSKQIFNVDIDVQAGDYIGIYYQTNGMEQTINGQPGVWYKSGTDAIPCTNLTFTLLSGRCISLFGYYEEEEEEEGNAMFLGTNF